MLPGLAADDMPVELQIIGRPLGYQMQRYEPL